MNEGGDEDTRDTQIRWDTPYTSMGWGGEYSSTYTHEESQDASHDDNEETDPDQDEYEPKIEEDMDASEGDDDEDNLFYLLLSFDFTFYNM